MAKFLACVIFKCNFVEDTACEQEFTQFMSDYYSDINPVFKNRIACIIQYVNVHKDDFSCKNIEKNFINLKDHIKTLNHP